MFASMLRFALVALLICLPSCCAVARHADESTFRSILRSSHLHRLPASEVSATINDASQPTGSVNTRSRHRPSHTTPTLVREREDRQLARAGVSVALPSDPAPAQWFNQRLDHFDRSDPRRWQQRYFVNASLWNGTGPVMFLFGHEREMSPDLVAGTWVVNWLAEQYGALIVCLEHRFYGASWPTNDTSLAFMQRYLSTEQALEDAAVWTAQIKAQYNVSDTSKWIVLGRSYGGTLAALFRLKFPHLVTGAFATSGPVQAKVDFYEYNEVVDIALGKKCSAAVKEANDKVTTLLSTSAGQTQLAADFGFCSPLTTHLQHAMLVESWSGDIGGIVQYSVGNDTQQWCDTFMSAGGGDPYKALIELYYPPGADCMPPLNYTEYVEEAKNDAYDYTWTWQTCSAYGWFQTGNSTRQPFSPLLDAAFSLAFCQDVFSSSPDEVYAAVDETIERNGGYNIQDSRVLYTNGELDPWHIPAIFPPRQGGHDNVVYLIEGASHCTDFMPPSDSDSASLKKLRRIQVDTIARWLRD